MFLYALPFLFLIWVTCHGCNWFLFCGFFQADFFITHNSSAISSIINIFIYLTIACNFEKCLLRVLTLNDIRMTLILINTELIMSSITQKLQRIKFWCMYSFLNTAMLIYLIFFNIELILWLKVRKVAVLALLPLIKIRIPIPYSNAKNKIFIVWFNCFI